ncbi:tRNA (adenosine(37)-N6)-dimethylallyltransferase MiaA [bacterium]|nr:tRNA (adenosine(37)-N6)-dimethylallyltransferase MiaA [bacterium]
MLAGPTASGKSRLALEIARRCQGELLCFDSTTVYRGLDIGTAKPTPQERRLIPHHLLDLVEAGEEFTLAHFLKQAEAALADIRRRGNQPILVGGTYLYLRAFLQGFQLSEVAPDPEFREWAEHQPLESLVTELVRLDPRAQELVDLANPRRVVRALEVCRSGKLFSDHYQAQPRSEPVRKIGLQARPDWLKARIAGRCQSMFMNGFREEVKRLCEKGLQRWLLSMRFIGYPEVVEGLELALSDSELAERVSESTWRLVKKQRTWGRSEVGVEWYDAEHPALVERVWEQLQTPTDK